MKKFCMCIALLAVTVVTASDKTNKFKPNHPVERVKQTDRLRNATPIPTVVDTGAPVGAFNKNRNKITAPTASKQKHSQNASRGTKQPTSNT
jgi:hypothetical protein